MSELASRFTMHCDFPSQDEKNLILGGNAAKLFDVE